MRLALIGATGHWTTYAPALKTIPGLTLAAVAIAGEEETPGAFDHAPGLTAATRRYEDARRMLDAEKPDAVQIACRPDRIPAWIRACLERSLPVMAEKPLAMDTETLHALYSLARSTQTPLVPMHTQRDSAELAAAQAAVRAGRIGTPLLSFSQKTYKWGRSRPDFYRARRTFPGIAPYIGVHAFDWLHWILGDVFTEVTGREGKTARPDYPACASQAAYTLAMENGGAASVTLDYLRPASAPTHGDERLRIAGTSGVIETALIEEKVTLLTADQPPQTLPPQPRDDLFTLFARSLREKTPLPIGLSDAFRITEIALKAQQAADTRKTVSLRKSPYTE